MSSSVARSSGVLERTVGDRTVLYNPTTDEVYELDAVGAVVWGLIPMTEARSTTELIAILADHFAQAASVIDPDVRSLLVELTTAGLVRPPSS